MAAITRVSVPGKLILMGEHAAVYGRPALVAAVGLRMHVAIEPVSTAGVRIRLPELGHESTASWAEIRELTERVRSDWDRYAEDPSPSGFGRLREADAAQLVKVALGETADALGDPVEPEGSCGGLEVTVRSEIPVGAGFGSSAAAAVGLVTGYMATHDRGVEWDRVQDLALEVERRQHGLPSGVDSATVYQGGVIWAQRQDERLHTEPLAARPDLLAAIRVLHTGAPGESTGAVVAEVRARRDRDPSKFETLLDRMEWATDEMRRLLVDERTTLAEIAQPMRDFQAALQEIGVVPVRVREIVEAVELHGGAAKISGAGSLSGSGAGCLLVVHPDPEALDRVEALGPLEEIAAPLGVEGARLESTA